jgi:hypothetical protein
MNLAWKTILQGAVVLDTVMKLRDRIVELRRVPASQLAPYPKNWRIHPKNHQNALRGLLSEIGIFAAGWPRLPATWVYRKHSGTFGVTKGLSNIQSN